jgi:hypothetical protein
MWKNSFQILSFSVFFITLFTNIQYRDNDYSEHPESGNVCEIRRPFLPPLQATFPCIVPAPVVMKYTSVLLVDTILKLNSVDVGVIDVSDCCPMLLIVATDEWQRAASGGAAQLYTFSAQCKTK